MPLEQDKLGGFKFALMDELRTGLWPDVFSRRIPLWETGSNIQFTDVGVEKLSGWEEIGDTGNGEPIRGLLQTISSGDAVIYSGDLSALYTLNTTTGTLTEVGSGYSLVENSGGTVWDSGATTWDSGATIFDYGITKASHWSMVNYGSWVFATNGVDSPQVAKSRDFVSLYNNAVTGVTITAAGSGYAVDEVLTFTGGGGTGATATVTSVDGSGGITGITMTTGGSGYTSSPSGHTSSGSGTSATFTHTISDMDVSTIEIFVNRGPHILGFNTSNSDKEFIWCDADDPDTWVTATDNLAGALQIRELKSPIRAAVPLGDRIAVYGDDQMFLVSYLGNELVFGYIPALNGIGAVSKHSVVPVGRQNYGLSQQGFYITDGSGFQYIDEPAIRKYYKDNGNKNQMAKAIAFHDEENTQVRWYFPTGETDITGGVSFNYKLGVWSILGNARTSGVERVTLESPVTGDKTGKIYKEGVGTSADGSGIVAWVRSKPLDFGDADRVKELDSIRIGYVGSGLTYRVGWSETENGTITWTDYASVDEGFDFENIRTAGRWLYLELYSSGINANWEVMAIDAIGRIEGTR